VRVAGEAVELGNKQHGAAEAALGQRRGELGVVATPPALEFLEGGDDGTARACRVAGDGLALSPKA
jgi:hypothetical protein